jgi:uncharacterized protein YbjQ (UPF0145 family)
VLIVLGLVVGGMTERRHLGSLRKREEDLKDMLLTQTKNFPAAAPAGSVATMLIAEVVIGSDYLKTFLASLRNIFGGEVKSFQSLLIRARREATLRIMEEAHRRGYNAICNLRIQTADVGGNNTGRRAAMAAILASGTAYHASRG